MMYYDILLGRQMKVSDKIMNDVAGHRSQQGPQTRQLLDIPDPQDPGPALPALEAQPLPMLAICDASAEGDPLDDELVDDIDSHTVKEVVKWLRRAISGRCFTFRVVHRQIHAHGRTRVAIQWECECPFHRDIGDAPSTKCKKSMEFKNATDRDTILRLLKGWALAGQERPDRAGPAGHKEIEPLSLPLQTHTALHNQLQVALAKPSWTLPDDPSSSASSDDASSSSS